MLFWTSGVFHPVGRWLAPLSLLFRSDARLFRDLRFFALHTIYLMGVWR